MTHELPQAGYRPSRVRLTPKARATRTRLLEAAVQLICDEGYHAANYARVAEAAGVVRGVINYHFPKHHDFLEALVGHVADARRVRLAQIGRELRADLSIHLEAAIDAYWGLLQEPAFIAFAELEQAARTDIVLQGLIAEPRRDLDPARLSLPSSPVAEHGADPRRQTLYDLSRFALEGLSRAEPTGDMATRRERLLSLLKAMIRTWPKATPTDFLWID